MNQLFKLKDSVTDYLSPKRRRTVGPSTPSYQEHSYEPTSEPQGRKAQAALRSRLDKAHPSSSDAIFAAGSRKRAREDECDTIFTESHHSGSEISPDESASQITVAENSVSDPPTVEGEGSEELEEDLEDDLEEEPEVSPEDKVAEYLARQAELELRKGAIAEVKAKGDWHPDEVFLFERLSLRSFEALLPADWKREFPTLPEDLFGSAKETTLFNYNCSNSQHGRFIRQLDM
jgi:hypothetical protein